MREKGASSSGLSNIFTRIHFFFSPPKKQVFFRGGSHIKKEEAT